MVPMTSDSNDDQPESQASKLIARTRIFLSRFLSWWKYYGVILPKDQVLRGFPIDGKPLKENVMQREVQACITWFQERNLPVRIISLKPRTKGSSTIFGAAFFHFMSSSPPNSTGRIIGGNEEQPRTMMEMLDKYARYDTFFSDTNPAEISPRGLWGTFRNGSQIKANTIGGKSQVIGSMNAAVWGTEGALWDCPGDDNIADAKERWANILIATPYKPGTMVFEESTARGAQGLFYDRYQEAEPWEQVKANGKFTKDTMRVSMFFPFFAFDTTDEIGPDLSPEEDAAFLLAMTDDERIYHKTVEQKASYSLTGTQMKWRRWAIANLCEHDATKFNRDYPFSAAEAFTQSGNPRFTQLSTTRARQLASTCPTPEYGTLSFRQNVDSFAKGETVMWTNVHEKRTAKYHLYEHPIPGCRYWVVCDPCEGKTTPGNKDPDSHGIGVFRQGYRDHHGRWHSMALVCQAAQYDGKKTFCRWEPSYAEQELWLLAHYYGGTQMTPIVIERPIDCGMNRTLRDKGAVLYIQTKPNAVEEKDETTYGFLQTTNTKLECVKLLAQRLNENFKAENGTVIDGGGILIPDDWTLSECEAFVTKPDGSCSAGHGHDDQVMKTAMACATEMCATPYYPPTNKLPAWELRDMIEEEKGRSDRGRQLW